MVVIVVVVKQPKEAKSLSTSARRKENACSTTLTTPLRAVDITIANPTMQGLSGISAGNWDRRRFALAITDTLADGGG